MYMIWHKVETKHTFRSKSKRREANIRIKKKTHHCLPDPGPPTLGTKLQQVRNTTKQDLAGSTRITFLFQRGKTVDF